MEKKYELTEETKNFDGRTLYRIRAVRDFAGVLAGELGGFIESEANLSHKGNAWVDGNAQVSGSAWVFGDARVFGSAWVSGGVWVSGSAWVFGGALVSGSARVFGDARVSGRAWVSGNALVSGSARVSGNAQVFGGAWVKGTAEVRQSTDIFTASNVGTENGTLTVYRTQDGIEVARGCFSGTVEEFLAQSEQTHACLPRVRDEYRLLIQVALSRLGAEALA